MRKTIVALALIAVALPAFGQSTGEFLGRRYAPVERAEQQQMEACYRFAQNAVIDRSISMQCGWDCMQVRNQIYMACMGVR